MPPDPAEEPMQPEPALESGYPRERPEDDYPREAHLRRSPGGWILLGIIFILLIGTTLYGLRKPGLRAEGTSFTTEEMAIKAALRQRQLMQLLPKAPTTSTIPGDTLTTLKAKKAADPKAARLYVEAQYESGKKVDPADLDRIAQTGTPADKAFAKIYQEKGLTRERAQQLSKDLPSNDFSYTLAKVHAADKAGDPAPRAKLSPPWKTFTLIPFILLVALGGLFGIGLWVAYLTMRSQGQWEPLGHPSEPLEPAEADRFGYRAVILILVYLFVQGLLAALLGGAPIWLRYIVLFGTMLFLAVALHRLPVLGMRIPLSRVGVRTDDLSKHILFGFAGYLATLPILGAMALLASFLMRFFGPSTHPASELIQSNPSALTVLGIFFGASVVAPFWEEIMFRGTMLPGMARFIGKVPAIALSSFLFASIHPQGVPLWPALGSIAAMSCLLSYQTRSLVPSITLHALNNTVVLILGLLAS